MVDAVTLVTDFKPREELVRAGVVEATMQFIDVFNAGANGAIRLVDETLENNLNYSNFFQLPSNFIERRDPTANTDIDTKKVTEAQEVGVKLNRRAGPIDMTMDAFKKNGTVAANQRDTFSLIFGREAARRMLRDKVNTALIGCRAAIDGQSTLKHTASTVLTTGDMIDGMSKFGDAGGEIVAWVMHSKPFYSLVKDQAVTKNIDGISNIVLSTGSPATIGRPVIVTDSAALITGTGSSGSPYQYHTLGLTRDGLVVRNSEPMTMVAEWITGFDNIRLMWQGEYAYNVNAKGYAFSTSGADNNPSDATLGTSAKWTAVVSDLKNSAGVVIESTG